MYGSVMAFWLVEAGKLWSSGIFVDRLCCFPEFVVFVLDYYNSLFYLSK